MYEMVLADESYSLFKGVLNSGLTPLVEKDIPKIGSTMDLTSWKVIRKNCTETEPLVARGVVFVDCLTWKQAPDASSTLQMLDKGVTPVEFDHCTAMFHSDFVESVLENCTFSIAESHSMEAGGKLLYYYKEKLGGQLANMYEHIKWGRSLRRKRIKLQNGESGLTAPESEDDPENEDLRCECVTQFDYHQCVVTGYPLSKCETESLFEMARDHVGDDNLVAGCFEELPASKQRWCFYWWYAVNIFHLKSKARKLPSCFINEVRNRFGEEDGNFTGFRSTQERLTEATFN